MKKQLTLVGALALTLASTSIFAQTTQEKEIQLDEVVISATKFKLKREKVGKVITKISQEQIKNNAGKTVLELLNNVTGVEIKGLNSNAGAVKGNYIRGGRSRQVLVMIDGVPVSDPTGISQEFDLRLLSLDQIESIEILKGASSTLYGSGAATGVINIILKKATKEEVVLVYQTSLGTNNDANSNSLRLADKSQNVSVRGTLSKFNYMASFNVNATDGMSTAKSNTNQTFTNDSFYSKNGMLKFGYDATSSFKIDAFLNFDEFDYQYDAGAYSDAIDNEGDQKQIRIGVKPSFKYANGKVFALASFNTVDRGIAGNTYTGESLYLELVNKYDFNNNLQLITGVNYQDHNNQTNSAWGNINADVANFNALDAFASIVFTTDFDLTINAGGRLNKHSKYGSHVVGHINPSFNVYKTDRASLKLLSSYSTAFIAPSLYQLFSVYGNLDLAPETNKTFELGFESTYGKWLEINAVYFNRKEEDAVIFKGLSAAPWGQYANADSTIKAKGIETNIAVVPFKNAKLNVGYTYTDKDAEARYIPKNKVVANFEMTPVDNVFFSVVYKNVGEREGAFYDASIFKTVEKTLPSYSLLDVNANYKILNETVTIFGSVTNLFNEDYEETLGFNTRGRNFKMGIRFKF